MDSQDVLRKYASERSMYFELKDGEEAEVVFIKAEVIPSNFDGGKTQCVRYTFNVDGVIKIWDRTHRELAQQMAKYAEGDVIRIRRVGAGNKTKYITNKVR